MKDDDVRGRGRGGTVCGWMICENEGGVGKGECRGGGVVGRCVFIG